MNALSNLLFAVIEQLPSIRSQHTCHFHEPELFSLGSRTVEQQLIYPLLSLTIRLGNPTPTDEQILPHEEGGESTTVPILPHNPLP
jgi:hypothetical protein